MNGQSSDRLKDLTAYYIHRLEVQEKNFESRVWEYQQEIDITKQDLKFTTTKLLKTELQLKSTISKLRETEAELKKTEDELLDLKRFGLQRSDDTLRLMHS
jgi:C4-dicarboxylate-specific signal transduction histidine kinase